MSTYTETRQKRIGDFRKDREEWSPEDSPWIEPRPIIVCDRCRWPFDIARETRMEHYNGLRCPRCGKENSPFSVLCEREPIGRVGEGPGCGGEGKDVYVIKSSNGDIKIGVSVNPERRLEQLNTGCPFELELVRTFSPDDAFGLESYIHETLSECRKTGEWFVLDDRSLSDFFESVEIAVSEWGQQH